VDIENRHARPFGGKQVDNPAPDAARAAGNQRNLTLQPISI
jgi:hypothetical protein